MRQLSINRRFRGPPDSANGGFACGALAKWIGEGPVTVTLRHPPPLEVAMSVQESADGLELFHGPQLVAEARVGELDLPELRAASWEEAEAATAGFLWHEDHVYPECFVCGPKNSDGLRLFPGAIDRHQAVAAPWEVPKAIDQDRATELMWAALDCPSFFGHAAFGEPCGPVLLGRLTAEITERVEGGARCIVAGYPLSKDGRKIDCASAIFSEDGTLLARAKATWIELKQSS